MQAVYDWVVDWLKSLQHCEFAAVQHPGDVVAEQALRCHECLKHVADASKQSRDESQHAQKRLSQANDAVQKALASVLQTAAAGSGGPKPPPLVAEKMAVWLKSIKDECGNSQKAADNKLHLAMKNLESAVNDVISSCYKIYLQDKPKTDEEMIQEMMRQVEMHMESLQITGSGESGGTGGLMDMQTEEPAPKLDDLGPASTAKITDLQLELARTGLQRLDSSQLECKLKEMADCGLLLELSNGVYETPDERDRRLAHNQRMRFNRSFDSEDWGESTIVYNATLTKKQKRRGKHVMKTFRELKVQYGTATAKAIRDRKKELGSSFWHVHPEDWECFKVWDSMEFESEEEDKHQTSFHAQAAVDPEGTKALMSHMTQPGALGNTRYRVGNAGGQGTEQKPPKGRGKAPNLRKQATSKLSQISSKLTESRVLGNEIPGAAAMSEKMKEGYQSELGEAVAGVEKARSSLEAWYARKVEEANIVGSERAIYDDTLRAVDAALTVLAGKVKAIKTALVVNKEFQSYGLELEGAAGQLLKTSGKWKSNFQRDMLRQNATSKIPVTKLPVPVMHNDVVTKKQLPVLLPHELLPWLVKHGALPVDETASAAVSQFWAHARDVGMPLNGATDDHIPLYLWGDDAQFTENQDKLVAVAMGRVLETCKDARLTVWPLFVFQQGYSVGMGTLNAFMEEVVKSLNILFEHGVMVETPSGEKKRVYAAVIQYQGDWKWQKDRL
ncbi:unnamed protein product [Symbiodinium sp. CCMP2592]|nr:unnamed protein product [Symbiodinium sp. CCMP2592]